MAAIVPIVLENAIGQYSVLIIYMAAIVPIVLENAIGQYSVLINAK